MELILVHTNLLGCCHLHNDNLLDGIFMHTHILYRKFDQILHLTDSLCKFVFFIHNQRLPVLKSNFFDILRFSLRKKSKTLYVITFYISTPN